MTPARAAFVHRLACWILVVLGVAHGTGTILDAFYPTFFRPSDPTVLEAMQRATVRLASLLHGEHMTLWRLHLGCNVSSAMGFVFTGALRLRLARIDPRLLGNRELLAIAIGATGLWTLLAGVFWFWIPFAGFILATSGLVLSARSLPAFAATTTGAAPYTSRLFVVGVALIGIAGGGHGLATIADFAFNALFSPLDAAVRDRMVGADLALPAMFGRHTSTWDAYISFNLGHGVATASFALAGAALARRMPSVIAMDRPLRVLFAAMSLAWFAVAVAFWFWAVAAITAIATTCHVVMAVRANGVPRTETRSKNGPG